MSIAARRGYTPDDERDFKGQSLYKLSSAAADLSYLLNHGYPIKGASAFVGNHFLLTERQRLAIVRIISPEAAIKARRGKEQPFNTLAGETVNIDGFNTIITLEVALSGSPVLKCMDGTIRDLAGLRGTYRIIDKTDTAVRLIIRELRQLGVKKADFWLDAPVSNSGRLKSYITEISEENGFDADIENINDVDRKLCGLPNVITSDSIILDHCQSWINLNKRILTSLQDIFEIEII
jgi:hypothetical protein